MVFVRQALDCPIGGQIRITPAIAQIALGPMGLPVPLSVTINPVVSSVVPLVHFVDLCS